MASKIFNEAKERLLAGDLDLNADDIRVSLHMTNTTIDTENDGISINSDFATPDEFDGSGYSAGGQALDNEAVSKDDTNDRALFDADDELFTSLGAGTRNIAGALVYEFNTNWGASSPIAWYEFSATPDGSNFTIQWNSVGLLSLA